MQNTRLNNSKTKKQEAACARIKTGWGDGVGKGWVSSNVLLMLQSTGVSTLGTVSVTGRFLYM